MPRHHERSLAIPRRLLHVAHSVVKDCTWEDEEVGPIGGKLLLRPQLSELVGVDELEQRGERHIALLGGTASLTHQFPAITSM
jgi:hypothetical protein